MTKPRNTSESSNQRTTHSIAIGYEGHDIEVRDEIDSILGQLREALDSLNYKLDERYPNALTPSIEYVMTTDDRTIDVVRVGNDEPI